MIEFELSSTQTADTGVRSTFRARRHPADVPRRPIAKHRLPETSCCGMSEMRSAATMGAIPSEYGDEGSASARADARRSTEAGEPHRRDRRGGDGWGDAAMLLSLPGPGLGGPPVRSTGTPEQKQRFFGIFQDGHGLHWGAYGLTEPGAGSDVAGIRTSCRKDGNHWVLNGRKCYITNGARAVVDGDLRDRRSDARPRRASRVRGREGHARVLRSARSRTRWACARTRPRSSCSRTAACPRRTCSAAKSSTSAKEGFMTAMKTFDNTRPLVGAMAVGIGRAAYEYARDFVKENYVLVAARPALRGDRRAARARRARPRGGAHRSCGGRRGWPTTEHAERQGSEHGQGRRPARRRSAPASTPSRSAAPTASLATRARAAREVVPRHQGLRHLRGHRADPAHRDLEAHPDRAQVVLTARPLRGLRRRGGQLPMRREPEPPILMPPPPASGGPLGVVVVTAAAAAYPDANGGRPGAPMAGGGTRHAHARRAGAGAAPAPTGGGARRRPAAAGDAVPARRPAGAAADDDYRRGGATDGRERPPSRRR